MREDEVISVLLAAAQPVAGAGVLRGPGDDAAALRPPAGQDLAWTVDDHAEDVHFRAAWGWKAVGRKAAGAALSDLAASGASPVGALLALTLPAGFGRGDLVELGRGFGQKLAEAGCPLVGGNVTRGPRVQLSTSLLGAIPRGGGLWRDGAEAGAALFVSGPLGLARAGLLWLEAGGDRDDPALQPALRALLDPAPRFELGLALRDHSCAVLDLSDGLARDLPRLARACGCAADVELARVPAPTPALAERVGEAPSALAWVGGEDYELLVAGPPALEGLGLTRIGQLSAGAPGEVRGASGEAGYDPFADAPSGSGAPTHE
ncbi:MAG: thiamine-phosphate kinase [Planctomycetes bacterium]|nr:thiamine-phosphate kinase [Planctomycetota bacterium]